MIDIKLIRENKDLLYFKDLKIDNLYLLNNFILNNNYKPSLRYYQGEI